MIGFPPPPVVEADRVRLAELATLVRDGSLRVLSVPAVRSPKYRQVSSRDAG
ncbi:hypothetical protein [Amycolatopsis acidicola]|uniref:hypothetical protein n=1 Tax=Amycolatopsis acidicola TaxID=2596893 RepID=UPI0014094177|nr:hypothetical protein [Amycolatopsis acidicola]